MKDDRDGVDGWGSHFPVLAAAVQRTEGPILELGAGHYSTPMLHLMCVETKRRLVTVESQAPWLEKFRRYQTPWHELYHVPHGQEGQFELLDSVNWAVAFVDHKPPQRRIHDIARLRHRAEFIVVHDTQDVKPYQYEPTISSFTFRTDWTTYRVWTSVLSMKRKFTI